MSASIRDVFCSADDGLKLHAWEIIPPAAAENDALPLLCLPGLTRTTADFEVLGRALANDRHAPRRVVAIDYRGRGLSDHDPDPARYTIPIEMGDVAAVAAHLGIAQAIVLGTSRGGLISMMMAAKKSTLLAAVILNDIGPALEMDGLVRISGYVGLRPEPKSWDDAAQGLKALFGRDFPALSDADWHAWAKRAWRKSEERFEQTYDPALSQVLATLDPQAPQPPPPWGLYDALQDLPLMLIHGGLSDLLSPANVREMVARRPDLDLVEVADQGHAPLLADAPTISRISAFCARCDQGLK
jgi:pimeloyl-ACP methyl ester carboxylesterase